MKNNVILRCFMILVLMFSINANAQKGEKMLGVKGGYATFNNSGYSAIVFQYSFAEHFRISPQASYIFSHNNISGFEFSIDMHFPFRVTKGIKLYPLAGVTFNNWIWQHPKTTENRFGLNVGGGADFYITNNLKISAQAKYSWLKNTDGGFFDIGIGYLF